MNISGSFLLLLAWGYLLGSVPFGKIAGKRRGIDIQKRGSGNIGFANVVRVLGWKDGIAVLLGDILKGFIPVIIAKHYLTEHQVLAVGLAAIIGHIFPLWLKFRGGKGIATGLGISLALNPALGSLGLAVYLVTFALVKKSAPSSIAAAWSLPLLCLLIVPKYAWFFLFLAVLATWTHRANIRGMIDGR